MEFSYVDPNVEHAERRATDGAFGLGHLLPWKQKAMGRLYVRSINGLICQFCVSKVPWCNG